MRCHARLDLGMSRHSSRKLSKEQDLIIITSKDEFATWLYKGFKSVSSKTVSKQKKRQEIAQLND